MAGLPLTRMGYRGIIRTGVPCLGDADARGEVIFLAIHGYGRLQLHYDAFGTSHSLAVNLTSAVDPTDFSAMTVLASELLIVVQPVQPPDVVYTGWTSYKSNGQSSQSGGFVGGTTGSHSATGEPWRSNTLTITGKATSEGSDGVAGNTRMVLHVYAAIQPSAAEKFIDRGDDADLDLLCVFLETSLKCWADYDGVKCSVRNGIAQQFNAHTQRKEGA